MPLIKHIYLMMTVSIASLFLAMYIYSGLEFCLIPVGLVLFDFVRAIRKERRGEVEEVLRRPLGPPPPPISVLDPRSPYYTGTSSDSSTASATGPAIFEFIKEDEFKL